MTMAFDPAMAAHNAERIRQQFKNPPNAKPDYGVNIVNGKPVKSPEQMYAEAFLDGVREGTKQGKALGFEIGEKAGFRRGWESAIQTASSIQRGNSNGIECKQVLQIVAQSMGVSWSDMLSDNRSQKIAWPRQIGFYLCRKVAGASMPLIGRACGGRDHSTILHAIRKVEQRIATDQHIANEIHLLTTRIYERCGIEQPREDE